MQKMIVVLPHGWVLMGDGEYNEDGRLVLMDANVVRRWGTAKGLGELALSGPTSTTVLDPCHGRVIVSDVLFTIDCKSDD